ncbi:MAG TPA: DUF1835 domain-containing protein [Candidatus Cybelea sp.]|jgi:hypothetical protein|nr:DUF1835 domain-containing protein [Candidatus Cybelea sp.]
MARSAPALHITNGDGALALLKKAGILGTHLAWRDALNDGPVPAGLSLEETSALRANYLAERGYGNPIRLIHEFTRRDAQLRRADDFDEVVLWFEHDLYDQLQLLQALTALDELDLEAGRIAVLQSDHYLSGMSVDEILTWLPKRRTATAAIFKSARRSWERFTSPSPADLFAAAGEDAIGLPFLRSGMARLCEEYPWTRDGLSRSQRQALYAVAQGPARLEELFSRAQAREEAYFLGERAFSKLLEDFSSGDAALIEEEEAKLVPTALGRRVLAGDADWLDEHRIDRWVGGVHLTPDHLTRWDEDAGRFL